MLKAETKTAFAMVATVGSHAKSCCPLPVSESETEDIEKVDEYSALTGTNSVESIRDNSSLVLSDRTPATEQEVSAEASEVS